MYAICRLYILCVTLAQAFHVGNYNWEVLTSIKISVSVTEQLVQRSKHRTCSALSGSKTVTSDFSSSVIRRPNNFSRYMGISVESLT